MMEVKILLPSTMSKKKNKLKSLLKEFRTENQFINEELKRIREQNRNKALKEIELGVEYY